MKKNILSAVCLAGIAVLVFWLVLHLHSKPDFPAASTDNLKAKADTILVYVDTVSAEVVKLKAEIARLNKSFVEKKELLPLKADTVFSTLTDSTQVKAFTDYKLSADSVIISCDSIVAKQNEVIIKQDDIILSLSTVIDIKDNSLLIQESINRELKKSNRRKNLIIGGVVIISTAVTLLALTN